MESIQVVLLMLGLAWIAIQTRHIICYVGAFIAWLFWGFEIFQVDVMLGLAVCLLAGYMMYGAIQWFWRPHG